MRSQAINLPACIMIEYRLSEPNPIEFASPRPLWYENAYLMQWIALSLGFIFATTLIEETNDSTETAPGRWHLEPFDKSVMSERVRPQVGLLHARPSKQKVGNGAALVVADKYRSRESPGRLAPSGSEMA